MNHLQSLPSFLLLIFCLPIFGCTTLKYKSYPNDDSRKPLSIISKHHETKVRTYFLHKEDKMFQLFNIAFNETNDEPFLTGYIIETDSIKVEYYHRMRDNPKYVVENPENNKHLNQAHIFVSDYTLGKSKKVTINNESILHYDVYESPNTTRKMSKGLQVAIWVGGAAAFTAGILFLWSLRPTWQN